MLRFTLLGSIVSILYITLMLVQLSSLSCSMLLFLTHSSSRNVEGVVAIEIVAVDTTT